ncbi:NAD(P)/FAD-dependent oxidoreductase [Virgibacillus halodenitrificans]|uniref:NAD(P)/FAD-dependent oxidoreductase n=1 Tax=Virgibacillus halodenitrificans TaxID=1482 RepID=UPI00031C278F|nr:FAD-binding oxidoreductase [Virgibacillus halodenitrificans]
MTDNYLDVVIVGGGLVGCATAYYLAKEGLSVTVIERGQINRQASGQNAGSLHFQLEHRLVLHWKQLENELKELIPLSKESERMWAAVEDELDAKMDVAQHGGLMIAETDKEVEVLKQKYELEKELGLETELLSKDEARKIAPYLTESFKLASFCPTEGHANPRYIIPQYAKRAAENGASFLTASKVTDLNRIKEYWEVEINNERRIKASNLVIATGAWAGDIAQMAGIHIPMYPVPLQMNITEKVDPIIGHLIQHVGKRISMKQVEDGNILIGGGWPAQFIKKNGKLDFTRSPNILHENIIENVKIAANLVPKVKELRLLRTWPGITGVSSDQLPILGEIPERKGLYIGGGGSAFTYGPLYGKILTELITKGKTDFSINAFSPSKFSHLNMFMP